MQSGSFASMRYDPRNAQRLTRPAVTMGHAVFGVGLLALLASPLTGAANAGPDRAELQASCWAPAALRGKAAEKASVYRRAAIDHRALRASAPKTVHPLPDRLRGAIRRVKLPKGQKLIALTFDLCETAGLVYGYDGPIVDYLRKNKVRTTFFASGKWLMTHEERSQQLLADPLFEVANHGWTHRDMRRVGGKTLHDEIALAQSAYALTRQSLAARACIKDNGHTVAAVPAAMQLFRFPYGTCNARALDAVAKAGLPAIQWDVVTGDPMRGRSARAIASTVLRGVRPGSIIIAHANGRGWNTAKALPLIVPKLRAQGYRFVTVSELLAAGEPEIASTCYTWRPGDQRALPLSRTANKKAAKRRRNARPLTFETSD